MAGLSPVAARDAHDPQTLAFYDREATAYAARRSPKLNPQLDAFIGVLRPGAEVLELGCGGGQDAQFMLAAGLAVTPTDGSAGLAREAERRLGRTVRLMRFDELDETACYDGVWANACLLHVPTAALPGVLARVWRALRPGGVFAASYKGGEGDGRDDLGRFYNFPTRETLEAAYGAAGDWGRLDLEQGEGGGYDKVVRKWFFCTAVKAATVGR
ncbi:MAG: class I SAM-dependent methyltransferase [Caulobacteraceae bacterium]|nr:class I SAM-dependent methyltransferase [Caulobacteraceae bacterium]